MKFITSYRAVATLLSVSVLAETISYTYMQEEGAFYYYSSSVLYAIAGLAICILPLINTSQSLALPPQKHRAYRLLPYVFLIFLSGLLVYHVIILNDWYTRWGINPKLADMIPMIQLSCRRLLHGIPVYNVANELCPGELNAYFPMMWIPYLPAEILGYDPRWTTVGLLFIALCTAAVPLIKKRVVIPFMPLCITGVSLFLILNFFLMRSIGFWTMTEEGVIAGFYMLLGYFLLTENYYLTGIAIGCCLLSRYALIPWIPVYFAYVFFTQARSNFFKLSASFILFVSLIFIIPYFIWNPSYFLNLPGHQLGGIKWFWDWYYLSRGTYHNVGFFKFFTADQGWLMIRIELITSFLLPVLFVLMAKKLQSRYNLNGKFIAFGSLKLALICFYNFIPTPYQYLFYPVTLMSYVVLFYYLSLQHIETVEMNASQLVA